MAALISRSVSAAADVMMAVVVVVLLAAVAANVQAPAPPPTGDGTSVDQGIAYVLMFVALVLTYLIHPFLDASSSSSTYKLF